MNALIWYFLSLFIKTVKMQKIALSIFEFVHFTRNLSYMALLVFYFFSNGCNSRATIKSHHSE